MGTRILLISDIHGNWPALQAVVADLPVSTFDTIINCGDSLVYGPFPKETLDWLRSFATFSVLGNTDIKVRKLLQGKSIKKPSKPEKRIMYESTAEMLEQANIKYLFSLKKSDALVLPVSLDRKNPETKIGIFHGSPEHHNEFLFPTTPQARFREIANHSNFDIILTGHSHTPYHLHFGATHFINPGSVGRMFDGDPRASCATLTIKDNILKVDHFRIKYDIANTTRQLKKLQLPSIYADMFRKGRKLN